MRCACSRTRINLLNILSVCMRACTLRSLTSFVMGASSRHSPNKLRVHNTSCPSQRTTPRPWLVQYTYMIICFPVSAAAPAFVSLYYLHSYVTLYSGHPMPNEASSHTPSLPVSITAESSRLRQQRWCQEKIARVVEHVKGTRAHGKRARRFRSCGNWATLFINLTRPQEKRLYSTYTFQP